MAGHKALLLVPLWLLALGVSDGFTQANNLEKRLKVDYEGKVVTLRNSYSGDRLRFNSAGELIKGGRPGCWGLTGKVKLQKIRLGPGRLEMQGHRLVVGDKGLPPELRKGREIRIEIELQEETPNEEAFKQVLSKIFLMGDRELAVLPPPSKPSHPGGEPAERLAPVGPVPESESGIYRIGGDVSAPVCLYGCHSSCAAYAACAEYSEEARAEKCEGIVVLHVILDPDGRVVPESIRIAKAAGMGLDEQAVEVVRKWRFKPAERLGKPVSVQFSVEINFRIH